MKDSKSAQSLIEMGLLAAIVVLVAISVMTIYNNQQIKTAKLTKTTSAYGHRDASSVDLNNMTPKQAGQKLNYVVTTAGALSLLGLTEAEYKEALNNLTLADLKKALENSPEGKDLLSLANKLGAGLNGEVVDSSTMSTLTEILNKIPQANRTSDEQAYIDRFKSLLDSSGD